ncbi:HNH endonuclease [Aquamicrobium sp. LC103]|uniref:HNH endonuclease n=1 Tax=Aquamicrobium sp. LC103 TaxID=1120658 RepID=UPI00063E84BC|nr:HNH endonuclease [Aquamicrobium sp. LC103]TKT80007.1 HNH endonuclease [Aquamicrobium sp. LC103]
MSWGFEIGRVYNRRNEVHPILGGNQQSGISYAANGFTIFFVTGKAGEQAGYEDRWRDDGVFEYCGEGQVGDQTFTNGNLEIRDHSKNGKQLLMFTKISGGLIRYDGEMVCEGYEWRRIRDSKKNFRDGIIFFLRPIDAISTSVEDEGPIVKLDLATLRARAYAAISVPAEKAGTAARTIYERSKDVRNYVLARAKGCCEGCGKDASFKRVDGTPYLEPHHIRRVSDGGPDDPRFVIGVCETCHRRVHHGADGKEYNTALLAKMKEIEPEDG